MFSYGVVPKRQREQNVIAEFCKAMRRQHQASFEVLPEEVTRQHVVEIDGETVDAVLGTANGPVAVELLGYSPRRDRGDVLAADESLRRKLKPEIYKLLEQGPYSLTLVYRERSRQGPGATGTVQAVPKASVWDRVLEEIKRLLEEMPKIESREFLSISFAKADLAGAVGYRQGRFYTDAQRFPVCATHLRSIRIHCMAPGLTPQVDSSLKAGFVGLAEDWVREKLVKKAELSLGLSKRRANGLPLWLVIHSDGHAINQKLVPEVHRPRAIHICQETLASTPHGFARAYWADETGYLDAAWVGKIL